MTDRVERLCACHDCLNAGVHLCAGCGEEIYCSKECQKNHWTSHKLQCKIAVKPETAGLLQSFESLSIKQLKNLLKAKAASLDQKNRKAVLTQLENIVEKPQLLKLVKKHVVTSEIETLLTNSSSLETNTDTIAESHNAKSSSSLKKQKATSSSGPKVTPAGLEAFMKPSPEQLRHQATMMRNNPDLVRKSSPHFAKMTNQQITQYADQLEKAASDPTMMKEIESMAKLTPTERDQLQSIQEGLAGVKPLDDKWARATIKTLKTNPGIFKTMLKGKGEMFGGVTDDQVNSFIDSASRMDATTLKYIFYVLKFIGGLVKPATTLYNTVDTYTLGLARYIVLAIVLSAISVSFYAMWNICTWIFRLVLAWWYGTGTGAGIAAAGAGAGAGDAAAKLAGSVDISSFSEPASSAALNAATGSSADTISAAAAAGVSAAAALGALNADKAKVNSLDNEFDF